MSHILYTPLPHLFHPFRKKEEAQRRCGELEYHHSQTFIKSKQVHLMQLQQQQQPQPPKQVQPQPQQTSQKPNPPIDPPSGQPTQSHAGGYQNQFYHDLNSRGTRPGFSTGGPTPDYVADAVDQGYGPGAGPPRQDIPRFPGSEHPPPPPYDTGRPPPSDAVQTQVPGVYPQRPHPDAVQTQVPGVYPPRPQPNQGDDEPVTVSYPAGERPTWPQYSNYQDPGQFGGGRGYGTQEGRQ